MHCRLLTQYVIIMVQFLAGLRKIKKCAILKCAILTRCRLELCAALKKMSHSEMCHPDTCCRLELGCGSEKNVPF